MAVQAITGGVASSATTAAIGAAVGSAVPVVGTIAGAAIGNFISRKFHFAKGGVVQGPTSIGMNGIMGESGPEAIMPLTSIGGRLGVKAIGSGGAKVVYNIDARGAAAGVEHQIMRVLRDVEDRAVSRAVNLVADSRRHGGVFGDAI
jgi:phage-related minor tail protein